MTSWWTDAIDSGDVDALAELISSGADLHAQDEEGNTALHAAAQGELACAAKLLELGANVNAQNGVGTTALIEAVKYGDCEQVKALLASGADAALADDEGDAHAHAAAGGDAEIVAALKGEEVAAPASPTGPATKKGRRNSVSSESVDPNQKVDLSQIPRVEKGEEAALRIKGCIKDSFLFQSLDAKTLKIVIDSMEEHPRSAELFEKVSEGDVDGLRELLADGVPAACIDEDGNTALIAAAEGESECAQVLIEARCPVDHQNDEGVSALMKAVEYEDIEVVRIFLAAGASLDAANNDGATAVEMAKGLADPEIYGLLTGTKVEHKEREAPAGGDGEEPKRRNSVSQQNLADFTDAFQDANRASAEEF